MRATAAQLWRRRRHPVSWPGVLLAGGLLLGAVSLPGSSSSADRPGMVGGYVVSDIAYTLDAADPGLIAAVRLTLDTPAAEVRVRVEGTGTGWHDCRPAGGTTWVCDTGGRTPLGAATGLRVVARS